MKVVLADEHIDGNRHGVFSFGSAELSRLPTLGISECLTCGFAVGERTGEQVHSRHARKLRLVSELVSEVVRVRS